MLVRHVLPSGVSNDSRSSAGARVAYRFPLNAVEVVLESVKRSLTEDVVEPFLHVLAEMFDVQRPKLLTVDEESLRDGRWEQGFNPRTDGLQPLFSSLKPEKFTVDVEVRFFGDIFDCPQARIAGRSPPCLPWYPSQDERRFFQTHPPSLLCSSRRF